MNDLVLRTYVAISTFIATQDAQDVVEYSLIIACLAFATIAGMHSLASGVSLAFTSISSELATSM